MILLLQLAIETFFRCLDSELAKWLSQRSYCQTRTYFLPPEGRVGVGGGGREVTCEDATFCPPF